MKEVKGGAAVRFCSCSCAYEGKTGGSSTNDNRYANFNLGDRGYSLKGDNALFFVKKEI